MSKAACTEQQPNMHTADGHAWRATASRSLQRCAWCKGIRHTAFVIKGVHGKASTHTHTRTEGA